MTSICVGSVGVERGVIGSPCVLQYGDIEDLRLFYPVQSVRLAVYYVSSHPYFCGERLFYLHRLPTTAIFIENEI